MGLETDIYNGEETPFLMLTEKREDECVFYPYAEFAKAVANKEPHIRINGLVMPVADNGLKNYPLGSIIKFRYGQEGEQDYFGITGYGMPHTSSLQLKVYREVLARVFGRHIAEKRARDWKEFLRVNGDRIGEVGNFRLNVLKLEGENPRS